jgi:hypothetical protein
VLVAGVVTLLGGCTLLGGGTSVSQEAVEDVIAGADVVASGDYGNPAGAHEFRGRAFVVRPGDGVTAEAFIENQIQALELKGWSDSHAIGSTYYLAGPDGNGVATFGPLAEEEHLSARDGLSPDLADEASELKESCEDCVFVTVEPVMK